MNGLNQMRRGGRPPAIPSLLQLLRSIPPEQLLPAPGEVIDVDAVRMRRIVHEVKPPFTCPDVARRLGINESAAAGLIRRLVVLGNLVPQDRLINKRRAYSVASRRIAA